MPGERGEQHVLVERLGDVVVHARVEALLLVARHRVGRQRHLVRVRVRVRVRG